MPLQTGRLTLLAIGVQNDQPPNALQPQLADGIHLRWASHPDVGLPWGGYFLLRRPHRPAREICWTRMWAERKLGAGSTVDSPLATPLGIFASDRPIRFVDDFPAAGQAELDLAGRSSLVLVFPPVLKGAYRVTARIGFRCDEANKLVEVPLGDRIRAPGATHLRPTRRLDVQAHRRGRFRPAVRTRNEHGSGVLAGSRARVLPGRPASAVRVDLSQSGASTLRAIDTKGNEVSRQTTRGTGLHTVELTGVRIATVIVESLADDVVIHNVAVLRDEECARETTVIVTAWSGDHVVARAEVSGRAGEVVDVELRADFMSHVVFSEAPAAVVELCVQAVDSELAGGWKPVPGTPCPFVLPVAHPDYTPPGRPTDFASARSLAMGRIAYGPTTNWDSGFGDLHATLETLVAGGPGSTPMNQRSAPVPSDDDPAVRMPGQNPLSLVNLAALHPAAAQLLGLYWNDEDVSSGQRWDYAVVADHGSRFRGDCDAVAAWLDAGAKGLDDVDVFVVRDRTLGGDPPPVAPIEIESFALPGAGWTDTAAGPIQTYLAGLTWQDPPPGPRAPAGGASVMFHIWRQDMPVEPTPAPTPASSDSFALVSANPVLRSMPTPTTTPQPQGPSDWPPDRMLGLDRVDAEGWFSYRISGIDLFGRHTQHSEAASWSTWAPPPAQLPWYWERADADGLVHPSAVALLDKEAPPPPMGITANLLDPHDPHLVRDAAYETWRASLPDAVRDDLVGLRIRFVWSAQLAAQAPDAQEFRIYYAAGRRTHDERTEGETRHWETRLHVEPIANGQARAGARHFDVFLPSAADASTGDAVGLVATPAQPVVYGEVTVSTADDKVHTADDPRWAGPLGGRVGNEGRVGVPATIFRVKRTAPDAPELPPDSERQWATKADYHGQSFHTFRWVSAPHTRANVYRALDDALFRTDRRHQPRADLDPQSDHFPSEMIAARRTVVVNELAQLSTASDDVARALYASLSNDALRVLASLPGNEQAFVKLTSAPLPGDTTEYTDTLDGRATNRWFYRARFVDGAHNEGPFSLSSAPVYLPNVVPPRKPRFTSVLAGVADPAVDGSRSISIRWATTREQDLRTYRVYRADNEVDARNPRSMTMRAELTVDADPALRPGELSWTDTDCDAGVLWRFRVVAVDEVGNPSESSNVATARAFDTSRPEPPTWGTATADATGHASLVWQSPDSQLRCLVQRRIRGTFRWHQISTWLSAGHYAYVDRTRRVSVVYEYRLRVLDARGRGNGRFETLEF